MQHGTSPKKGPISKECNTKIAQLRKRYNMKRVQHVKSATLQVKNCKMKWAQHGKSATRTECNMKHYKKSCNTQKGTT